MGELESRKKNYNTRGKQLCELLSVRTFMKVFIHPGRDQTPGKTDAEGKV